MGEPSCTRLRRSRAGGMDCRNPESEQLRSFLGAASHSSRNTLPTHPPSSALLIQGSCASSIALILIATCFVASYTCLCRWIPFHKNKNRTPEPRPTGGSSVQQRPPQSVVGTVQLYSSTLSPLPIVKWLLNMVLCWLWSLSHPHPHPHLLVCLHLTERLQERGGGGATGREPN